MLTCSHSNDSPHSQRYESFFHHVVGFFVIEFQVLSTTQHLLTRQWVDDLWDVAVAEIARVLHLQLAACKSASTIFRVKQLVVLFSQTLQGFSYSCSKLFNILLRSADDVGGGVGPGGGGRDRYNAALLQQCATKFHALFAEDTCVPMQAENEAEFGDVILQYPPQQRELQSLLDSPFPRIFPFSAVVPQAYSIIREFIDDSVKFVKDLDLSDTELDEAVRKSTNVLLSKVLSAELSKVVRGKTLTLIQLAQISVNTTHLESACTYLEAYISKITHSVGDDMHINRLHGSSVFKDARTAAEDKIFDVLQKKIDALLELSDYDLGTYVPREEANDTLFELLAYLSSTFVSIAYLFPREANSGDTPNRSSKIERTC